MEKLTYKIINLKERPDLHLQAAEWFSSKWELEASNYLESIQSQELVPSWFLTLDEEKIIGGLGVIENDFHNRPDLSPNICALFVEERYRGKRLAQKMLEEVGEYFNDNGISSMYLITDHEGLYEKYQWTFETLVQATETGETIRLYSRHK